MGKNYILVKKFCKLRFMRWQLIITFFRKLLFVKLSKSEMIEKCYNVKPDMGATIVYNICMTCTMRNSCD